MNPFPVAWTLYRSNRGTVLLFLILIAVSVGIGVALSAQERALRQGSARAADRFDLIVAAPGSQTDILMNVVYLRPSAIELLKPATLVALMADRRAELVAPIAFGDSVGGFSVIGTTAAFVDRISGALVEGRTFEKTGEAVVGWSSPYSVGRELHPVHGHGETAEGPHGAEEFLVVGRMARTGTPWDTAIVVPVEQNWRVHGLPVGHAPGDDRIGPPFDPAYLPGVPAIVVSADSVPSAYALRSDYRTEETTAFFPAEVLVQLYAVLGNVGDVLSIMTGTTQILVVAAILAGLMALVQLQRERFSVLRALGAPASFVFAVVWVAVTALVTAGTAAGLALGLAILHILSQVVTARTGIAVGGGLGHDEFAMSALIVATGGLAAVLPALLVQRRPILDSLRN